MPKGVYIKTEEHKKKISEGRKGKGMGNKGALGYKHSEEAKRKMSESHTGKHLSEKVKQNLSKIHLGEKNKMWKGDKVGYIALHEWVSRNLGKPRICKMCNFKSENTRQFHWANKSRQYKRDLEDWIRLCVKCHKVYDLNKIEIT